MDYADTGPVEVPVALVERLVAEQCPHLTGPVRVFAQGWDNTVFTLGADYLVRVPCRAVGARLLAAEQRALPRVAEALARAEVTGDVPVPVHVGVPSGEYPWPWSVVPHLPGTVAYAVPPPLRSGGARLLARILVALHRQLDPGEQPVNDFRNGDIGDKDMPDLSPLQGAAYTGIDPDRVERAWRAWSSAPRWVGERVAVHGDVHPGNVLLDPFALIDWGDTTAGDPAVDLAGAWTVFDPQGSAAFAVEATRLGGYDEATWRRARAWALRFALAVAGGPDTPLRRESPRILSCVLSTD